jgi:hypothetical protein
MVEHEIDAIVLVADGDSFLSRLEAETTTEFQQEGCTRVTIERYVVHNTE